MQPTAPAAFTDPGAVLRAEAVEILSDARASVLSAGDKAASAIMGTVVSASTTAATGTSSGSGEEGSESDDQLISIDPETGEVKVGIVGVDGSITWHTGSAEIQKKYGSLDAKAGAEYDAGSLEGSAGIGLDDGALSAEASGSANLLSGSASASVGVEHGHLGVDAKGSIGAYGEAGVTIGSDGVGVSAGGFIGGKASVSGEVEVGGVTGKLGVEGWAGAGAELDGGLTKNDDGSWTLGLELGAAVGVGAEISPEITIDPDAVGDAISDALDWLGGS